MREPAIVRDATAAYEADQDTVKQFVEESCHVAVGQSQVRISTADARRAYEAWCHDIGVDPVNPKRFGMELRAHWSVKPEKLNGVRFYTGITLLVSDPGQSDPEDDRDRGRYR
jgi:putative DNA primase/helicase